MGGWVRLIDWLVGWLVGWFVVWLVGWLVDWLVGRWVRLIDCHSFLFSTGSDNGGTNAGLIVGIVFAIIIVAVLVLVGVLYYRWRKQKKPFQPKELHNIETKET